MAVLDHSKYFFLLCAILALINCCNCAERKIQTHKFKCKEQNENITIVYVTATDQEKKNTVHFIWSVYDTPSIIVAWTSKYNYHPGPSITKIDCKKLTSNKPKDAIIWKYKYDYISAFEIAEVDELNDPDDKVIFSGEDFKKSIKHNLRDIVWKDPTFFKNEVTFEGTFLGGNIVFMFNSSSEDGRGAESPRQLYSNNGTRFAISLKKLEFNTTKTRIALKVLTHTAKYPEQASTIFEDRSIDDEFSPGVFRTFVLSNVLNSTLSSFVSWKPVSFYSDDKSLLTQLPSYQYSYVDGHFSRYTATVRTTSMSSKAVPSKTIQAAMDVEKSFPLMISFGQKKDGWYQKHAYLKWSGQVSYGVPQFDKISKTLFITIIVGLGLPVAFIIAGSVYVCFKKYRERMTTSTYGKIN